MRSLHDSHGAAGELVFSSDGAHVFGYADSTRSAKYGELFNTLRVWDITHNSIQHTIKTQFSSAEYSPGGRLIVTVGPTLRVWDAVTGRLLHTLRP